MNEANLFDRYASGYDDALAKALGPSGESRQYFAEGRVSWLSRCLAEVDIRVSSVLDYGCGDGSTTPLLLAILNAESATGVDLSRESLEIARRRNTDSHICYMQIAEFARPSVFDLAYCNGVFHHIEPRDRAGAVAFIHRALRDGGLFSFWENNPWNPATRYVMSQCEFDTDAITLSPRAARKLLRENGFEILRSDFRFIFPRMLRVFRKVEDVVHRLPIGTQYQILCRKIDRARD